MNVADRALSSNPEAVAAPDPMLVRQMADIGKAARKAARTLASATTDQKNSALKAMAMHIRNRRADILKANEADLADANATNLGAAPIDRLTLTDERIEAMAKGIEKIAALPDPVGQVMSSWDRPNGLKIERVRTPLGVIGVIYESRPNVTADAGALCLKAGNAVILRGGSDSFRTSEAIHRCLTAGLELNRLPVAAIQLVPSRDRAAVGLMLGGLDGNIDVIVPRGGKSLVERVQTDARVPVFAHLEGVCHVYVDRAAELEMAKEIVVNSKMRRTGVCGAAETLLVDRTMAHITLLPLIQALVDAGCTVKGDEQVRKAAPEVEPATEADWSTEYLDSVISVKLVAGLQDAIDHIEKYGSHHTDCIVTRDVATANRFMALVDSAIVLHNASTQFADGGEFGMGAEIGIATGKMHARGPIGVEQLTTFKYKVRGTGQLRP